MTPQKLTPLFPSLPPILYINHRTSIPSYSKALRGLSVQSRVIRIFTYNTISPGPLLRQRPNHYAIRAGQNLPDKEFRYLRTVIVTAAVHWGFDSMLAHLLLTFQHRAGVSSYTSSFDLAQTCVFGKQLLGPILCGSISGAPLLPKLRGQFAEFLNNPSPVGLRILSSSTCVGLRYGHLSIPQSFSRLRASPTSLLHFAPLRPGQPTPGFGYLKVSLWLKFRWLRNFYRMCIAYASRPELSSRLTLGGRTFPKKP